MTNLAGRAGQVRIGEFIVNRLGLGTNRLHDNPASYQLLEEAVNFGVNFFDTAHSYAGGESETAIGKVLSDNQNILIATKGGMGQGASARQLRLELEESLTRVKREKIDLYQLHRVDANVPLEDSLGEMVKMKQKGLIANIGLSEVSVEQIEKALTITDITTVQNEYNVANRHYDQVVDFCTTHQIIFIPWFPLGGLSGDTATVNQRVRVVAEKYGVNPQRIALSWLLARSPWILPIPGTLSKDHLEDNLRSAEIELSDEDNALLSK